MPLPVLPLVIGGAGVALLLAGSKEKGANDSATSGDGMRSGGTATPTTQTTGGDNGGASAPSHADYVNTAPPAPEVDGPAAPGGFADATPLDSAIKEATGIVVGDPEHVTDVWAPTGGSSLDAKTVSTSSGGALGAIATVGGLTGQAAADAFEVWAGSIGAIW